MEDKSCLFVVLFALIIFTTLPSCAWLNRTEEQRIIGDYDVGWADVPSNRFIGKSIKGCNGCYETIVEGYVYAVGHNDSFIIAKQHSGNDTATYYYIIDIKRNEKPGLRKGVYESLDKQAFDSLRNRLRISDIPFDMNYPEDP